ncbi:hypothetical protein BRC84_01725 [Halobacteriales archaeon QS_1_68_44]|nr:MAG: hypothetical protein BRC84_01725 [Halobacteriales archaeon QS_1_68_44]
MSILETRRDVVKSIGAATIAVGLAGCNRDDDDGGDDGGDDGDGDDDDGVEVEEEERPDGLDNDGEATFGPEDRRQAAAE